MNRALILGKRHARMAELAGLLDGLGLRAQLHAADLGAGPEARPRVLLADEDADGLQEGKLPAGVSDIPIRIAISGSGSPVPGMQAVVMPPATEASLARALLDTGYYLPADAECAAIAATLHDLVEGDSAIVGELIDSLIATGEADIAAYRARCAEGNWLAAGALAHRIKGTARMAGCASLTRLSERIEAASRAEADKLLPDLNAIFAPGVDRLCAALRELRRAPPSFGNFAR
ncbi:Hpt domain [Achromobacter denitrificans]|uniref:Hpt domain-containing protein n=1 Tax=Achromobacter denitrificans TaxID=32002 RepID=UPI000788E998|nr:Hpt domain-containing protein [Achromobacter denitrificans]OLU09046.1 phosphorelay protein [Achromobacter denitrificans]QKH42414.1 Hpt domain-containing protein [Achromobacter denitrificans]QKH50443.1 Hpt domain-containing protein [Achromobacter denitrificans]CAB3663839.1 hypothetical protein LMG1231_00693 [Achromobacter denitrificans]SUU20905.1 Hpt domain [Achromobacter denitrificans]